VAVAPRLTFDSDPLHTKNPSTEAMRTLRDLMDEPLTNPYTIDVLLPDIGTAAGIAAKLKALPTVDEVARHRQLRVSGPGQETPR